MIKRIKRVRVDTKTNIVLYAGNKTAIINEKTSVVAWNEVGNI